MSDIKIHLEHLTRVEGHGNIVLNTRNGAIEQVQWQVSEAPRFFESFVRGRPSTSCRTSPRASAASAPSGTRWRR